MRTLALLDFLEGKFSGTILSILTRAIMDKTSVTSDHFTWDISKHAHCFAILSVWKRPTYTFWLY